MAENNAPCSFPDPRRLAFELRKARAEIDKLKFLLKRMRQDLRRERAECRRLHVLLHQDDPPDSL